MRESHLKLRKRRFLQLFKSPAKLIRTRGALCATTYTIELLDDIVNALSAHKLTDSLQVTVTTSQEKHLLDHIVLIGCHIDHRACLEIRGIHPAVPTGEYLCTCTHREYLLRLQQSHAATRICYSPRRTGRSAERESQYHDRTLSPYRQSWFGSV